MGLCLDQCIIRLFSNLIGVLFSFHAVGAIRSGFRLQSAQPQRPGHLGACPGRQIQSGLLLIDAIQRSRQRFQHQETMRVAGPHHQIPISFFQSQFHPLIPQGILHRNHRTMAQKAPLCQNTGFLQMIQRDSRCSIFHSFRVDVYKRQVGVPAQQRKQTCVALIQKYGSRRLIIAIRPRSAD